MKTFQFEMKTETNSNFPQNACAKTALVVLAVTIALADSTTTRNAFPAIAHPPEAFKSFAISPESARACKTLLASGAISA